MTHFNDVVKRTYKLGVTRLHALKHGAKLVLRSKPSALAKHKLGVGNAVQADVPRGICLRHGGVDLQSGCETLRKCNDILGWGHANRRAECQGRQGDKQLHWTSQAKAQIKSMVLGRDKWRITDVITTVSLNNNDLCSPFYIKGPLRRRVLGPELCLP